jgi:N-acetylmuramoyl-L-alanine amidase
LILVNNNFRHQKVSSYRQQAPVFLLMLVACSLLVFTLSGCATSPILRNVPSFYISGKTYYSLVSLCKDLDVNFKYDTFTSTLILEKNLKTINLEVNSNVMLVNGEETKISTAPILSSGVFLAPYEAANIINDFFRKPETGIVEPINRIAIKKIVVDAGHGGKDPGAIGKSGLKEKGVNLRIAKYLVEELRRLGFEVVLTRDSDKFIELERRAEIANDINADLFLCVHSNASKSRRLSGFEVYYLTDGIDDFKRCVWVAEKENLNEGALDKNDKTIKAILGDMFYAQNRSSSVKIAKEICALAKEKMDLNILGIKGAPFCVLKTSRMSAVLVEVGFVSNLREEKLLANDSYCRQLARTIALGVDNYDKKQSLRSLVQR